MPASQQDKLITAKEVAEMTGLAVRTVLQGEAGTKELLRIKLGRLVRFSLVDVQSWIERKKTESSKPPEKGTLLQFERLSRKEAVSICNRFKKD